MNRRTAFAALAAAPLPASAQSPAGWSNPFALTLRDSFIERWKDTREYTLAMLDAMPADGFATKPDPAQRTFGEQMVHLAIANIAYFRALGLLPVPDSLPIDRNVIAKQINQADKAAVRRYVADSFDYVAAVLDKMTEKDLTRKDVNFGRNAHSGTDVLFRAYMHTAHHRGQTVVYLRVKGIVPPAWKFEPTA
ncbi:MAG: DinB family protein [Bryobacterales bacterium]|nr:DinB family protein [Bryobacterales bacterium]